MTDLTYKIKSVEQECFFLKVGAIITVDFVSERVYSEDGKSYMPLYLMEKMGVDAELIKRGD